MKNALYFFLLFSCHSLFAQILLEHTYDDSSINRINLESSGEKYWLFKRASNELVLYNADHSWWKTIVLPAAAPTAFTSTMIFDVSELKFNNDPDLEIAFGYFNNSTSTYVSRIISEGGNDIYTFPNTLSLTFDKVDGLQTKIFAKLFVGGGSQVYSFPEPVLESTYLEGDVKRIKLENSGEKYYVLDKIDENVKLYNANHSLWKTIDLPKPVNTLYAGIGIVSESLLNPDALVEIGYTYFDDDNTNPSREGKVINENGDVLLTIPNASYLNLDILDGGENKLFVTMVTGTGNLNNTTTVYQLPSLLPEHEYETLMKRINLDLSGEKYYTYGNMENMMEIYNSDHTLWKSIPLPLPDSSFRINSTQISENKINDDPLIEVIYSSFSGIFEGQSLSNVINEDGEDLLTAWGASGLIVSEFPDLENKLIATFTLWGNPLNNSYGKVYHITNLGVAESAAAIVTIYPNPVASVLNVNSVSSRITGLDIYSPDGKLAKQRNETSITSVNVDDLASGIYFIRLTTADNFSTIKKIAISH